MSFAAYSVEAFAYECAPDPFIIQVNMTLFNENNSVQTNAEKISLRAHANYITISPKIDTTRARIYAPVRINHTKINTIKLIPTKSEKKKYFALPHFAALHFRPASSRPALISARKRLRFKKPGASTLLH